MHAHKLLIVASRFVLGTMVVFCGSIGVFAGSGKPQFGRPATPGEITALDIEVRPDGSGLPPGSGTSAKGEVIFESQCAACHGKTGIEGPRDHLVGGQGSLTSGRPLKTIGSYWEYAPTIYDYISRSMPFTAPGTLTPDEVYSLVAYLLNRNGVIEATTTIDHNSLPLIRMPNRDGFIVEQEFRNVKRK